MLFLLVIGCCYFNSAESCWTWKDKLNVKSDLHKVDMLSVLLPCWFTQGEEYNLAVVGEGQGKED